jgi:ATP-dependent Clp protease adaptor protein ClpS
MSDLFTQTDAITKIKMPSMWKVVIINDDFTPVDFVIAIIHKLFNKSIEEATLLTYMVHNSGKAVIGLYTKEFAETKVMLVHLNADQYQHPLKAIAEEA